MAKDGITQTSLRSPLGRVRGMGSAKTGTHHWWMQRVTSIALLPLTIWFVASMIGLAGASYLETLLWIAQPLNAVLLLVLIGLTFHHMAAGLQVVVEDYVRDEFKRLAFILLIKAASLLMALASAFAVLRIAFAL
ncbi:succinate dehydrogenase, hydrophobic membrane anchor protein [Roseococcus sp. SDR]|uniref:succinate dehydrogenase, hydrophobic membrane anchor protein n=1 Tax=Roseococcus sp. SDR TaxID=2835532 RepID=UPI001BCF66FB|nr:succinate dehydrogenase, hydrophobic membrane anchor protein [Roseococcus sp. SDR]MBS7791539.1 succinate dehydrogenase, hydrophobic membrane anchor protein [Roseococcus sp. SDR]MBV1846853.1 succinate dehydrogenase, hydrophobic membrane anchor protein [Roseococcus sp. SDR]